MLGSRRAAGEAGATLGRSIMKRPEELHCELHIAAQELVGLAQTLADMGHSSMTVPALRQPTVVAAQHFAAAIRSQLSKVDKAIAAIMLASEDDVELHRAETGEFGGH
jgi:hypothetical protein